MSASSADDKCMSYSDSAESKHYVIKSMLIHTPCPPVIYKENRGRLVKSIRRFISIARIVNYHR